MSEKRNGGNAGTNETKTAARGAGADTTATGTEADFESSVPPALDDEAFLALMESSYAASQSKGAAPKTGPGGEGEEGDGAMRDRVWEKLQARIAAEGPPGGPSRGTRDAHDARDARGGDGSKVTREDVAGAGARASAGPLASTRPKTRWVGPLAGLAGLAAAALLFVRLGGGGQEGVDPMAPGGLKGDAHAVATTLEARWDPSGKVFTFHATSVPAGTGAGLILFDPEGGTPRVVARGTLAPLGGAGPRTLVEGEAPITWAPPADEKAGRICLFTAEGLAGLASLEAVATGVFDRHPADLCQDVRVP